MPRPADLDVSLTSAFQNLIWAGFRACGHLASFLARFSCRPSFLFEAPTPCSRERAAHAPTASVFVLFRGLRSRNRRDCRCFPGGGEQGCGDECLRDIGICSVSRTSPAKNLTLVAVFEVWGEGGAWVLASWGREAVVCI